MSSVSMPTKSELDATLQSVSSQHDKLQKKDPTMERLFRDISTRYKDLLETMESNATPTEAGKLLVRIKTKQFNELAELFSSYASKI